MPYERRRRHCRDIARRHGVLDDRGRSLWRHGRMIAMPLLARNRARSHLPGQRPVEIGGCRRAWRLGRLPAAFRPAHQGHPQDDRRAAFPSFWLKPVLGWCSERSRRMASCAMQAVEELSRPREQLAREASCRALISPPHPHAPFLWLKLPEPWLSGTFKNAAIPRRRTCG